MPSTDQDQLRRRQRQRHVAVVECLREALAVVGHVALLRSAARAMASMIFV